MTGGNGQSGSASSATGRLLASPYALACVLVLALLLRVGHVLSLRSLPLFDRLWLDSEVYDQWALDIAAGNWLGGDRAFFMDPLYSYVLAIVYSLFGHDLLVARLLQAGLGCATCALVALIGYRVSGSRAVSTVSAFLMAVYEPAVFQEGEIEKTALGVFLITAALACAAGRGRASCFFSGVFLALASLTRGNLLLLLPLGIIYFIIRPEHEASAPPTDSSAWRDRLRGGLTGSGGRNALLFLAGSCLILSAPLLRNHHVSGEWVIITSMAGQNLYTGNNPYNAIGAYKPLPFVRPQSLNEEPDFRAMAESLAGRPLTPGEASSFWLRESLRHIVENPGFAATAFARKFCLFWSDVEVVDTWDMYFMRRYSPVLRLPLLNFSTVLMFAVIGALHYYKKHREVMLLAGFIAAYSVTVTLFFILSRYRIHAVPTLAVLSALGLSWTWGALKEKNWKPLLRAVAVGVPVFLFSYAGSLTFGYDARESVNSYTLLAELYRKNNDLASAEQLLKEALHKFGNTPPTLQALGLLYASRKDPGNAYFYFNQCVTIDESYPDALFLLGISLESLGKTPEAIEAYKRQLVLIPNHAASKERLSVLQH